MQQSEFTFPIPIEDIRKVSYKDKNSIYERWNAFHEANPHIYQHLLRLSLQTVKSNKKIGIAMLFEVLRWQHTITTNSANNFKLSNCFRAPYARYLMLKNPELVGLFDLKRSKTDIYFETQKSKV